MCPVASTLGGGIIKDYIDELSESMGDFMEAARRGAGLDSDLREISNLTSEEMSAVELLLLYSERLSNEERFSIKSGLSKIISAFHVLLNICKKYNSDKEQLIRKHKEQTFFLGMCFVVIIIMISILTFSKHFYTVDPNDGSVWLIQSKWWGISSTEHEIRWMKTAEYDYPGWMTRDSKGSWYLFISEDSFQ